jgi:hypothetical protein
MSCELFFKFSNEAIKRYVPHDDLFKDGQPAYIAIKHATSPHVHPDAEALFHNTVVFHMRPRNATMTRGKCSAEPFLSNVPKFIEVLTLIVGGVEKLSRGIEGVIRITFATGICYLYSFTQTGVTYYMLMNFNDGTAKYDNDGTAKYDNDGTAVCFFQDKRGPHVLTRRISEHNWQWQPPLLVHYTEVLSGSAHQSEVDQIIDQFRFLTTDEDMLLPLCDIITLMTVLNRQTPVQFYMAMLHTDDFLPADVAMIEAPQSAIEKQAQDATRMDVDETGSVNDGMSDGMRTGGSPMSSASQVPAASSRHGNMSLPSDDVTRPNGMGSNRTRSHGDGMTAMSDVTLFSDAPAGPGAGGNMSPAAAGQAAHGQTLPGGNLSTPEMPHIAQEHANTITLLLLIYALYRFYRFFRGS